MLKSSLCDYIDAYILAKGTIAIAGEEIMMLQNEQIKKKKGNCR